MRSQESDVVPISLNKTLMHTGNKPFLSTPGLYASRIQQGTNLNDIPDSVELLNMVSGRHLDQYGTPYLWQLHTAGSYHSAPLSSSHISVYRKMSVCCILVDESRCDEEKPTRPVIRHDGLLKHPSFRLQTPGTVEKTDCKNFCIHDILSRMSRNLKASSYI